MFLTEAHPTRNLSLIRARAINRMFLLVALAGTSLGAASAQTTTPPKATFSLALKPEQSVFNSGQPVKVVVTLTNGSDHAITIWRERPYRINGTTLDQGGFVYKFHVLDEKGSVPADPKFGKAFRGRSDPAYLTEETPINGDGAWIPIQPGKTLTDTLNVSTFYDFKEPGKYRIYVERFDDESKSFVQSNEVTVTVK